MRFGEQARHAVSACSATRLCPTQRPSTSRTASAGLAGRRAPFARARPAPCVNGLVANARDGVRAREGSLLPAADGLVQAVGERQPRTPLRTTGGSPLSRALTTTSSTSRRVLTCAALGKQPHLEGPRSMKKMSPPSCMRSASGLPRPAPLLSGRARHAGSPSCRQSRAPTPSPHDARRSRRLRAQTVESRVQPSYCQTAKARLFCRIAASRPWPCSTASSNARRISSSPCDRPVGRAPPRAPSTAAARQSSSAATRQSARSASTIASAWAPPSQRKVAMSVRIPSRGGRPRLEERERLRDSFPALLGYLGAGARAKAPPARARLERVAKSR
jgi:hypothetical protein